MKKVKLERYFKLFTNEEAENFFDGALQEAQIHFVKREIPDSKFSEYFFDVKDLPSVEKINEQLKAKEIKETEEFISKKNNKPYAIEHLMMLVLIAMIILMIILL